jgi:Acetamidase/Formamidase family
LSSSSISQNDNNFLVVDIHTTLPPAAAATAATFPVASASSQTFPLSISPIRSSSACSCSFSTMPPTLIAVDPKKKPWEQETPLHNRWHPSIPPVATVQEGQVFRVECVDWTGGQIQNNDSSDDVKNVDLSQVHYLSGPIAVQGAQAGDLLKVEFLNLGTLQGDEWGFTGSFARENGGGFLTDHFPCASKACWDLEGIYCSSR